MGMRRGRGRPKSIRERWLDMICCNFNLLRHGLDMRVWRLWIKVQGSRWLSFDSLFDRFRLGGAKEHRGFWSFRLIHVFSFQFQQPHYFVVVTVFFLGENALYTASLINWHVFSLSILFRIYFDSLYLSGWSFRNHLCVSTIPRPYLWDYIGYIVVVVLNLFVLIFSLAEWMFFRLVLLLV